MPNLNDLSQFLKKDDVKQEDILIFVNEGEIADVDFSKTKDGSQVKRVFQILVELVDSRQKILTLNRASIDSLSAKWGTKTEAWIGKKAQINFMKQLVFGKLTDVMVLIACEDDKNTS